MKIDQVDNIVQCANYVEPSIGNLSGRLQGVLQAVLCAAGDKASFQASEMSGE